MATSLSQAITDAYLAWRSHPTAATTGTLYTGTVSELQVGDFVYGARAVVTVRGALSGSNRSLTLARLGQTFTVSWVDTSTVYFER